MLLDSATFLYFLHLHKLILQTQLIDPITVTSECCYRSIALSKWMRYKPTFPRKRCRWRKALAKTCKVCASMRHNGNVRFFAAVNARTYGSLRKLQLEPSKPAIYMSSKAEVFPGYQPALIIGKCANDVFCITSQSPIVIYSTRPPAPVRSGSAAVDRSIDTKTTLSKVGHGTTCRWALR